MPSQPSISIDSGRDSEGAEKLVAKDGMTLDMNNMPGKVRKELILNGTMDEADFICPPNMPGKKLAAMREAFRKNFVDKLDKQIPVSPNQFKVGDLVQHMGFVTEIIDVHKNGLKYIVRKKDGKKSKWVHASKLKVHEDPNEEE